MKQSPMNIAQKSTQQVAQEFETDITHGLTRVEADKRCESIGPNRVPLKAPDSYLKIFIDQFKSPLIYVLLIAAAIIYFVDSRTDALFISFVLLLNAFVGTYQEGKSGNILSSLRKFLRTYSVVLRGGTQDIVASDNLVPGDILVLNEGDQIPADCRLIEATNFYVNQASITGEAQPVAKRAEAIAQAQGLHEYELANMVFSGSLVTKGIAKAIVVATGTQTATGRLHTIVEKIDTTIPLKLEIERIAYFILWIVLFICAGLFAVGFATGKPIKELLTILTALFICVVPEGLPVIFTLVLAMGVARMAKKMVLVKRLQAVEGLGQVDVIALDKTGTLTRGEIGVQQVFYDLAVHSPSPNTPTLFAAIAALQSQAQVTMGKEGGRFVPLHAKGDQTEVALTTFAKAAGVEKSALVKNAEVFRELVFDHATKLKVSFVSSRALGFTESTITMLVTGAPEVVWERCKTILYRQNVQAIDTNTTHTVTTTLHDFFSQGLRVVAAAYRQLSPEEWQQLRDTLFAEGANVSELLEANVSQLTYVGMYGLADLLREGVGAVVSHAAASGVQVVMLTGDHEQTALSIAQQCHIFRPGNRVLTGEKLRPLMAEGHVPHLDDVTVFARVTPEDKLHIVQALRSAGHIVAMTGDGVNDAPPIAVADIGIAMGRIGTEVAKEAADIILLDDRFESIVEAIKEGRHIFYTLKRVILYFFATNMAEILVILFAICLGLALPLNAIQILWINLVTDGFLNMSLSLEGHEQEVLMRPIVRGHRIIDQRLLVHMLFMATPMALGSLYLFYIYYDSGVAKARTIALITMSLYQLFNAWNCRSDRASLLSLPLFGNMTLVIATFIVLLFQAAIIYLAPLQTLFRTVPLLPLDWVYAFAVSSLIVLLEEFRKFIWRFASI